MMHEMDMAALEARLLASFKERVVDVHTQTACDHFHIKPSQVTDAQRRWAKNQNYLAMYSNEVH